MGGQLSGAHNNDNFRQCINVEKKPALSDLNTQGILNEYYYDTGLIETKEIFEPSYNFAKIYNDISKQEEYYVGIGLNCRDDGKNLRNSTNLLVILDISGSMNDSILLTDEQQSEYNNLSALKKIDLAKDVISNFLSFFTLNDYFGLMLFNFKASVIQSMEKFTNINQQEFLNKIKVFELDFISFFLKSIQANSGTNMELALKQAIDMFGNFAKKNKLAYTNNDSRIIFITDAQPNSGNCKDGLLDLTKKLAIQNIFITYIGKISVGLDFNNELTKQLTQIRGCNFFSVNSASKFKKILLEDFNYIITPQVFDAKMELESQIFEIGQTYGTNFEDQNSKYFFKIETIMASDKLNNSLKGGIILAQLKKINKQIEISDELQDTFILTYELAKTKEQVRKTQTFNMIQQFSEMPIHSFTNSGIRKAILLITYTNFLKQNLEKNSQLTYSNIINFINYFMTEQKLLNDESLTKELEVLEKLKKFAKE